MFHKCVVGIKLMYKHSWGKKSVIGYNLCRLSKTELLQILKRHEQTGIKGQDFKVLHIYTLFEGNTSNAVSTVAVRVYLPNSHCARWLYRIMY